MRLRPRPAAGADCHTAAFKVHVALPGSAAGVAGATLDAKVQTLRALPDKRLLAQEDLGALVPLCGGTEPVRRRHARRPIPAGRTATCG